MPSKQPASTKDPTNAKQPANRMSGVQVSGFENDLNLENTIDPATQGFVSKGVPEAGILPSTTAAPSDPGTLVLNRYAIGTWDSPGATPTHEGIAGP